MSSADVVYYNLTLGNNDPVSAGQLTYSSIPASIDAYNNQPIIQNPDDYYASIIRFSIPCLNLPLIKFIVQTNQPDINLGVYSFTILKGYTENLPSGQAGYTSKSSQQFVEFTPTISIPANQIPTTPVGAVQQNLPYYLVYDYLTFLNMWNTALALADLELYPASTTPPFFEYSATTQLITLYIPPIYKTDDTYIACNNQFLQYMLGFPKINYTQSGQDNQFGIDNVLLTNLGNVSGKSNLLDPAGAILYYGYEFQYTSYGYWNFLKSILITTTMNVNSEAVYNFNNANAITTNSLTGSTNQQNVNYINILEDFIPDLAIPNGAGVANQIFTYFAQSLYRVFTFNQKTPLYKINLGISIVDTYGNIIPLTIPKGQSANFKIMFIKKSIYASMPKMLN